MEQRIEELALKCGAWHQVYGNRNFMLDEHFDIAKFAELIVRECATEADKQTIYCRGIPWGRWIKEHFGLRD
jgi:nuclear transport factor 2 (NTF2) superfamily protein